MMGRGKGLGEDKVKEEVRTDPIDPKTCSAPAAACRSDRQSRMRGLRCSCPAGPSRVVRGGSSWPGRRPDAEHQHDQRRQKSIHFARTTTAVVGKGSGSEGDDLTLCFASCPARCAGTFWGLGFWGFRGAALGLGFGSILLLGRWLTSGRTSPAALSG